ncbi:T9SS type A sorting domain-containing protein [uncultured Kordia sp.]|uniref:T9SS type A sorting domain-containing protein n=1 Tax=uncultured Kordia sp. TaxID=507699 RepID=UPI00260A3AAC|nr:T9SS type A sorting domain-containing protein [uncultured Kordia sp.]
MNLKFFTLTTLFFFFIVKTNAQTSTTAQYNKIGITLSVEDSISGGQSFKLTAQDEYLIFPYRSTFFEIDLEYQSTEDIVSYFGIQYKLCKMNEGIIGEIVRGVTVPVLIPPVRKKKSGFEAGARIGGRQYPHKIYTRYVTEYTDYFARIILVKYDSRQDYLDETNNFQEIDTVEFDLIRHTNDNLLLNSPESFTVTTHPNPITNQITITTQNAPSPQAPMEVVIFNNKGIKVSNHTLVVFETTENSISYNLDTTHLPKGVYYYKFKQGTKTLVKTIIKE